MSGAKGRADASKSRGKSVLISDVAKKAGVHPGTVSRVLNPERRHLISDKTAHRVERAAEELGYEVNQIARGLRTRRSYTIGVLIPDLTNPLFPPMVRGIEDYLAPFGYTALLANTDSDPEHEAKGLDALAARQVDGFLIAPTEANVGRVAEMVEQQVPVVLINRHIANIGASAVAPDDRRGAVAAVDHLVGLGHERIAHIGGPKVLSPGSERYQGYLEAVSAHDLHPPRQLTVFAESFVEGAGVEPARELLTGDDPFTAIFAANDLLALDAIDAIRAAGLECPRDISVIGFNDMPFADRFDPPLTTIHFSHYDMGRVAAELLMAQISSDGDEAPRTVVLATELTERGSTAKPRKAG